MKQAVFTATLVLASIGSAFASPASDAAQIHVTAIGAILWHDRCADSTT